RFDMNRPLRLRLALVLLPVLGTVLGWVCGCGPAGRAAPPVAGEWRAVLTSPGGELPFGLRLSRTGRRLRAVAINGPEQAPFSSVEQSGRKLTLEIDWYDSRIDAEVTPDGDRMTGVWTRTEPGGPCRIPFAAVRGKAPRFAPAAALGAGRGATPAGLPSVSGEWSAEFKDADGVSPAQGELRQEGE